MEARTDADLLSLYAAHRDEDAFALLVRRNGPMVLGVCRRALGNSAEADDAFQAAFLALSQNASQATKCVPGWLYRVAVRSSHRALHRQDRPVRGGDRADPADPFAAVEWRDVRRLLDEELSRLPARWRSPLVLCYLDGRTRDEAALQLGWSLRTLHRRLDEGRKRLRERLVRRGMTPAVLAASVLSADALRASLPPALARDAAALASRGAVIPPTVRALVPTLSSLGGLAMKSAIAALVLASGVVLLFGGRQPAGADPIPEVRPTGDPAVLALAPVKPGKPPADPTAEKVKEAQEKAIKYLKAKQIKQPKDVWNWESDTLNLLQPGGSSALALLALLESGVKPDDEVVARGLKYLRTVEPKHTYVVSLQTQVFCKANQKEDADRIKRNVKWLEEAAVRNGKVFDGWSYTASRETRADHSNTRFAVAALHAAHTAGFKVQQQGIWDDIRALFIRTQKGDGGWGYTPEGPKGTDTPHSSHTMTFAGLLCLSLANDVLRSDDKAADGAMRNGNAWIGNNFRLENPPSTFYNFDVIAAFGRASDRKNLGTADKKRDWYREGAQWLLENQKPGGEWQIKSAIDDYPIISTSFALRFLAARPD